MLTVLHSEPSKQWVVRYLADALGTSDEDGVRAIVADLIESGRAVRADRGRFRAAA